MHLLKTYEQTGIFDPTNPTQRKREVYTGIPGGYGSFYWNVVPTDAGLKGAGLGFWTSIPSWGQALLVGAVAAVGGYFGVQKWPQIKKRLLPSRK